MNWEEFLQQKKIDGEAFRRNEPGRYAEWERAFVQMHPESFTTQKKFLLNEVRRKYLIR